MKVTHIMICYELITWCSQMGGLLTAFLGTFTLISSALSEVLLLSSILDSLFFIKTQASTKDEKSERK